MDADKKIIEQLLSEIGIRVDGTDPWDIQIKDERFFSRVLRWSRLFGQSTGLYKFEAALG